jgi:hypothetical protein
MSLRIDQYCLPINDRIAIITHSVFRRNLVIGYAFNGKDRTDGDLSVIRIRAMMLTSGIRAETRALIDSKKTGDPPADRANCSADYATDRASRSVALMGSFGRPTKNALRSRCNC